MNSQTQPERATGASGFTLIEVLIAMVILSVGLMALEALGIGAARMVSRADARSEHVARATSRLESIVGQIRSGGGVPAAGSAQLSDGTLYWRPAAVSPSLSRVRVSVIPRAGHPVLRAADSVFLSVDVFVPVP